MKLRRGWPLALLLVCSCGSKSSEDTPAKSGSEAEVQQVPKGDEPTLGLTKTPSVATEKAEVTPALPAGGQAVEATQTTLAEMDAVVATIGAKSSGSWKRMHKSVQAGRAAYQRAEFTALVFAGQRGWALAPERRAIQPLMLTTEDGGDSWKQAKGAPPLSAVDFVDDKRGIGMNVVGTIVVTTDGGATWTKSGAPRLQRLLGFHMVDADRSIAIINDQLKQSVDGGKSWQGFFMPSYGFLRFVNLASDGTAWAIGLRSNKLAVWQRPPAAGASWSEVLSLAKDKARDPYGAAFLGDDSIWIVGDEMLVFTHDGGASWKRVSGLWPNKFRLHAVHFADLEHGWVVGYSFDDKLSFVLHTADGGKSWTPQTLKAGKDEVLTGLSAHGDELWAYGQALYKLQR